MPLGHRTVRVSTWLFSPMPKCTGRMFWEPLLEPAIAKGVPFRKAVTRHALRNSMIPIATTFGQNIVLLVSGSFLIETIFDINGFGLLGLTAILDRDYPIVMGVILLASILLLIGNIISDFLVALVDPRIRFQ